MLYASPEFAEVQLWMRKKLISGLRPPAKKKPMDGRILHHQLAIRVDVLGHGVEGGEVAGVMTGPVIEQPIRAHSTHPPVGPLRCACLGTRSMPPVWGVKREERKLPTAADLGSARTVAQRLSDYPPKTLQP